MNHNTETNDFNQLLSQIFQAARQHSINQKELAVRAGITPETLSRMKSRGSGDFGVLNKMAHMVGLRLTLAPDDETLNAIREGNLF
jgi:transcriptional regulator with XRE-family HTH domain